MTAMERRSRGVNLRPMDLEQWSCACLVVENASSPGNNCNRWCQQQSAMDRGGRGLTPDGRTTALGDLR